MKIAEHPFQFVTGTYLTRIGNHFEPFYFLESVEVTVPFAWQAWTLEEFREALAHLSNASFHFHFLVSRLRLQLQTNDFSPWFAKELGLETLAQRTNQIDIYTNTLDGARAKLFQFLNLPPWSALEINALQRASTIIIQKSLREGFGLTVTEALWKKKPVVASAVGGIPTQIVHKHTGLLVHSVEGTACQIRFLLSSPALAQRLGENGHEHVREHFLITSNVRRYLTLFLHSLGPT